jgi:hypothetical protein
VGWLARDCSAEGNISGAGQPGDLVSLALGCVHWLCFTAQYHSEAAGGCGVHSRVPALQHFTSCVAVKHSAGIFRAAGAGQGCATHHCS